MNRGLNLDAARAALGRPVLNLDQLFASKRALFGDAVMTAGGPGDGAPAGGAPAGGAPAAGTETYDLAHVQRVAAQEKASAERAAAAKVAETLGMTPEEAKAKLDAMAEAERKAMSEADRKAAEAADVKAAGEKATADAAQVSLTAKVTQQLLVAGVDLGGKDAKPEDRAEKLAIAARLVNLPATADDAAITAAVERVKTMVPALFEPSTAPAGGGQGDAGAGPAGRQQQAGAFGTNGAAEFDKRFPAKAGAAT